jgi:Ca-activated chloride channel family protein
VGASRVSIVGGRVQAGFRSVNLTGWMQLSLALGVSLGASVSMQAQARPPVQINTNVQLVQVPVIVFDDKGGVASNLKKDDFRLFEDGVEQRILYCEREREPVSFVILDDLSSSMTRKIPFVQEATLSVLDSEEQQERYRDEFSVYGIASRAKNLVPFTRDQKDLERRLPWLLTPTNGSTALFDGIYLGISEARDRAENKHRAMIIISDGGDNHSRYNLRETKSLLEEADVPVFAVMAGSSFELPEIFTGPRKKPGMQGKIPIPGASTGAEDFIGPAERRGPHNLQTLTEATGGGVFTAKHEEDLPRIVRTISNAVRYRYILSYKPPETPAKAAAEGASGENRWHKIFLELNPKEKFKGFGIPYYKRKYYKFD